ncbi:Adenine-specific methyltransferase [Helicobacter heilmannii]|nr:Adenine-specific methyltransferase [Helicobacter heilmannii]CRF49281.1 Adenine-specific methyltransferase [Helicobacter heilmannii]
MAIHNKSHKNHALISLNKKRKNVTPINQTLNGFCGVEIPLICLKIADCCEFLREIPDNSVQLICIDPPYNLELAGWDFYENYMQWASRWLNEAYRVLSDTGNIVIFGGTQFRGVKFGDLIDII